METMEAATATPTTGDAAPATDAPDTSSGTVAAPDAAETQDDTGEQTTDAAPPPATTQPEPPARYRVKVNGEEREVSVDELRKRYELEEGANAKFERAAQLMREAKAREETLKADPVKALLSAGLTRDQIQQLSEKVILEQIQEERLTPEQRRIRELEGEIAKRKEAEEGVAREAQERQVAEQEQTYLKDLSTKLTDGFTKLNLPLNDALLVSNASRFLQNALQAGEQIDPAEAAEFVQYETMNRTAQLFTKLSGDQILEFLGKANADKIRKADIARLKSAPQESPAPDKASVPAQDRTSRKIKSADDFFDSF